MVRLISRQREGVAALKLTKLFGIDDFPAVKDSGKVLIIIIIIIIITREMLTAVVVTKVIICFPPVCFAIFVFLFNK